MKFLLRDGQEKISHAELAPALQIEPKTVKYHIGKRREFLESFGEIEVEQLPNDRRVYYLNKKQTLLLMTFVSRNPAAKITIINLVLSDMSDKSDAIVESCKEFLRDVAPKLNMAVADIQTPVIEEPSAETVDKSKGFPEQGEGYKKFMEKVDQILTDEN